MKPMSDVELNKLKQLHELLPLFNFIIDIFQIDKENIALSIQELNNFKNYHSELNKLSNDQQLLLEIIIAVRIMNLEAYRCYFNEKSCETIDLYIKSHEMIEFYLESEDFENFKFKWNKDFLFQIILYFLKGFSYLLKGNGALFLSGAKECMNFSEDYFNKTNRAIDELKKECENHEENKILQEKLELFRKICDALISCIILLKYSRDIELCPISDIERYKYQSLIEKIDETSKKFIFANLKTWSEYNRSVAFKIWSKFLIKKIDYKYILIKINDYNELLEYLSDIYNLCKDGSVISRRIYETLSIIDDKAEIERFGAWEKYYELFSQIIKGEIEVLKIEIQVRDERKTLKKDFEIFEYRHEKIQDNESLKNINNKIKECFEHFKKSSNQNNNSPKSKN